MLTVLCVLRSGGVYDREYVKRLARGVERNLDIKYKFMCLTDDVRDAEYDVENGIQWEPLVHYWPKWWSKVEMFRPDLEKYGRFLYLDLDMVVTGDLSDIAAYEGDAAVTYDFGYDVPSQTVLNFTPGALREIWDTFTEDPESWMTEGDKMKCPYWGDQILTSKAYSGEFDKYQDLVPGQIVSYKIHCNEGLPENARLVSFHGDPKPHGVNSLGWVSRNWK